ncbi:Probable GTP-binding protein EngB [Buchnera aphidicola (Eriosoma grossulariae)]
MFLNYYKDTYFLTSMVNIKKKNLFKDGKEIAFLGYSNVGKSSVINILTDQKFLSKTSKKPGTTRMINFFEISPGYRLVDLPGYGYAKVSKKIKFDWNIDINKYLLNSTSLIGLIIFMDIRYIIKELDKKFLNTLNKNKMLLCIVLTKADKLSFNMIQKKIIFINKYLSIFRLKIDVIIFSSFKNIGINELKKKINCWFTLN